MCDSEQKSSYEHGSDFERMVRIFFLPYLGNRSKSDPCSYELFCSESHILSFPKVLQIPSESLCIMGEIFLLAILNRWSLSSVTVQNRTHVHMNFFAKNHTYY